MAALLVTPTELRAAIERGEARAVDCRFDLMDPAGGRSLWAGSHIPGAPYADLDQDLAGPARRGGGRHPLPEPVDFAAKLERWGIAPDMLVVAYDNMGGAIAARLWWMLKWMGHERAGLLDGGMQAWEAAKLPLERKAPVIEPTEYPAGGHCRPVVDLARVERAAATGELRILDARDAARYQGLSEPIDAQAGHVPGAVNAFFRDNLGADGRFLPPGELRALYLERLDGVEPGQACVMCGSGVTACHDLFAMERAGLPGAALYPGSWSEWSQSGSRPVARGPAPGGPA
ncbi:MAG: sulfurtransferase [Gammaproteobacteria bacterium]|nr:sulfurtransferase [Gammaproteobacteria bacterium]